MKLKDHKISVNLTIGLLIFTFCLCMLSYNSSYADLSLDLIQVTYNKPLEYFSIEPLWIHTTLDPSEERLNRNGFYSSHLPASGSCALDNKQLAWEYKPRTTSNVMDYCGASKYGGTLTVKVDGKIIMDTIPIGGDPSCYGSPIYKIVINTYDDQLEAFIHSDSEKPLYSLFVDFDNENPVPITFEYIKKNIKQ